MKNSKIGIIYSSKNNNNRSNSHFRTIDLFHKPNISKVVNKEIIQKRQFQHCTRTRFLKLNLLVGKFEIMCTCQSQEEAKLSPFHFELEYYNSDCDGCQKKKSYTLIFNYAIMTKEHESLIYECIIIGLLIVVGIIGLLIYKYFALLRYWKQAQARVVKLETTSTQVQIDFSINDSKIGLQLEVENQKKSDE